VNGTDTTPSLGTLTTVNSTGTFSQVKSSDMKNSLYSYQNCFRMPPPQRWASSPRLSLILS